MGYKQALKKIEELHQIVAILDNYNNGQEITQDAINIVMERARRVYDMLEYEHEYNDADLDAIDYGDGEDLATIRSIFNQHQEIEDFSAFAEKDGVEETLFDTLIERVDVVVEESKPQAPTQPQAPVHVESEEDDVARLVASYNKRRSDRYRKILSLYVDNPATQPQPTTKPKVVETVMTKVAEKVIDVQVDIKTLLPESFNELNDEGIKLLTNELFNGDAKAFVATLLTIDEQSNLEEAIFFIAENFVWDGDSDAAKLLFTLLQRRFS